MFETRTTKHLYSLFILLALSPLALGDVTGRVVAITDGDTIKVLDSSKTEYKVRLTGIDAPERGQPYGNESRKYLESLIAGKDVQVESTKRDRYGRILGKVLWNGIDVNLEQVKAGYAWWYRYYQKEQSWEDRQAYEAAEKEAKQSRLGLWADPQPIEPYHWRKLKKSFDRN